MVILAEAHVDFVIVGGVAVTLHGYIRLTEDVDILVEPSLPNLMRLLGSLANYGEGYARQLTPEDFTDEEGAIRIVEVSELSQIDIFTRKDRSHRQELWFTFPIKRWPPGILDFFAPSRLRVRPSHSRAQQHARTRSNAR